MGFDSRRKTASEKELSRRGLLQAGAFGGAVASLAQWLQAEEAVGSRGSSKAVVFVHLDGGPPQLDLIDLKPEAPVEIRGEFEPIATAVAGIQICELLPKLASIADRVSFVRSLVGSDCRCENWFDRPFHFDFAEVTSIGSSSHWSFSQALVLAESVRCLLDLSKIEARVGGRREASRVRLHPVRNLVTQPE